MFLGIDQAAVHSGVVVLPKEGNAPIHQYLIDAQGLRDVVRLDFIYMELKRICREYGVRSAALEGYSFGSTHRGQDLGEVGGVVRLALRHSGVEYVVIPPTSLKKYVTGNGGASKDQMAVAVQARYGVRIDQNDICDAYGLAHICRGMQLGGGTTRAELEVIKTLKDESHKLMTTVTGRRKPADI